RMTISKVNFYYGSKQTLFDITLGIATNKVTALIGPSGCGKSTLIRTLNRMYETVRNARLEGEILLDGQSILVQDVTSLRRRVGMVFQRPNPFPKSIFDNVAYGLRINGSKVPISKRSKKACGTRRSGTKSKTISTSRRTSSPATSHSPCASPALLPSSPKFSSSMNPAPRSIHQHCQN